MNYRKDMERVMAYIEDHLKTEITIPELAELIGYSPFYFSRIWSAYRGMTVMEYVRYRRLSLAARSIFEGRKITEAAFDFGFDTVSGFSKAFKRQFGCSPSAYQGQIIQIETVDLFSREQLIASMRLEELPLTVVAGYPIGVPVSERSEMVALWGEAGGEEDWLEPQLYEELNPSKNAEFGIAIPDEAGQPQYVLALHLDDEARLRPLMKKVEIKGGLYAVFTTPPVDLRGNVNAKYVTLIRTWWKSIFVNFFDEDCPYEYDSGRLDFEYYDERTHSDVDAHMEIWVPVNRT